MPNRILRDGILTSEKVARLGWAAEVFYRRLMSVADDYGRFHAMPKLLRSACYPLQIDKVSDADIGKWLSECETAGLVSVYPAKDGKRYIQIVNFGQQVRAKSKFPASTDGEPKPPPAPDGTCKQLLANAHLVGDGVGDVIPPHPPASPGGAFARFWESWPAHPRKVAREQCERKWASKGCEVIAEQVLAALEAAKASEAWAKEGGEFIPAPLVWLNQARWEAPVEVDQVAIAGVAAVAQTTALLREQAEAAARARSPEAQAARLAAVAKLRGVAA